MYDDLDLGSPVDFDDFDLPDPESEEDVSEDPTAVASTEDILAAVAQRMEANLSIGEVDLATAEEELEEGTEPTLAHQPVQSTPQPAGAMANVAPAPTAQQAGTNWGGLFLTVLLACVAIAGAAFLAFST